MTIWFLLISLALTAGSIIVGKDMFRRAVNVLAAGALSAMVFLPEAAAMRPMAWGVLITCIVLDLVYMTTTGRK